MNRKTFLTLMAGTTGMASWGSVRMLNELYTETHVLMLDLFWVMGRSRASVPGILRSKIWVGEKPPIC